MLVCKLPATPWHTGIQIDSHSFHYQRVRHVYRVSCRENRVCHYLYGWETVKFESVCFCFSLQLDQVPVAPFNPVSTLTVSTVQSRVYRCVYYICDIRVVKNRSGWGGGVVDETGAYFAVSMSSVPVRPDHQ